MNPFVLAFISIGPACFVAGIGLSHFLFAGKSSPPANNQTFTLKDIAMAVYAEFEQPLADLNAAVAALPDKLASLGTEAALDKADSIAAVLSAVQGVTAAINAIGAPPVGG